MSLFRRRIPSPVEVAAGLRGRGHLVFLDAGSDADGLGRWSYVAAAPTARLVAWGDRIARTDHEGAWRRTRGCPFAALEDLVQSSALAVDRRPPNGGGGKETRKGERGGGDEGEDPAAPPLRAGVIGWLGYELGRAIERLPSPQDDRPLLPDLAVAAYDDVLAFDHELRVWHGGPSLAGALAAARELPEPGPPPGTPLTLDFDRASYVRAVGRVREHILEGDVYQVNLSQRFRGRLEEDPFTLYRRLRARRAAPLGAFLEWGSRAVLSNSPELFLSVRGARVETRPIKGTRPRGATEPEDAKLLAELEASEKDRAELTMIVDLLRNDLGKVATTGTVRVEGPIRTVTLPTVHHRVATIAAEVEPGTGLAELLRATFPGGSITGCPKVRAQEVIAALEPCRRGVYTGAIGWMTPASAATPAARDPGDAREGAKTGERASAAGGGVPRAGVDLTLSVAIRTLSLRRGALSFHAGGGVVLDSDPEAEYEETLAKSRAFLEALGATIPGT